MRLRLLSFLLPTAALLLVPSISNAQPRCLDYPYPLHPRKAVVVDCPIVAKDSAENKRRALYRRDQLSYSGADFIQIDFTCRADAALCANAKAAFQKAGEIISGVILFTTPIVVNASFISFCSELGNCGTSQYITLGGSFPARTIAMQDSDGIGRYYPQSLVKQLNFPNHPAYGPYDITSMFNADAPFWFDDGTTINETQSDFLWAVVHEFMHGLGFYSNWNDYINQTPQALTPDVTQYDTDGADSSVAFNSVVFTGFYESAFDKFMVFLPSLTSATTITKSLDQFNGGIGTKYSDFDAYFSDFVSSPQYTEAVQMLRVSVTTHALGFMPVKGHTSNDVLVLETSLNPFAEGSSISHVDYNTYTNTSDFLMRYLQDRGVTLAQAVERGGDGPIGPGLLNVLESLGYATISNPNPNITISHINSASSAARTWSWFGVVVGIAVILFV